MTKDTLDDFSKLLKTLDARYQHLIELFSHQIKVGDRITDLLVHIRHIHGEIRREYLPPSRKILQ